MLASIYRFHGRGGIRHVYRMGHTVRQRSLTCRWQPSRGKRSRLAVVVSKKVLKSAVGRNRIRRRVYEALRLRLPELTGSNDIVVIVTSAELRSCSAPELSRAVDELLMAANLYKPADN